LAFAQATPLENLGADMAGRNIGDVYRKCVIY
jgi:hypothetical protein